MTKEYTVKEILHSGRKGERYTPMVNYKYKGVIGYNVKFDIDNLRRGKSLHMNLCDSPEYDWWETSMVLAVAIKEGEGLEIETENSIYILDEVRHE